MPLKPDTSVIQEKLDRAFHLLSEKKSAEAEHLCVGVLEHAPGNTRALYLLGVSYCLGEQYEKAIAILRQVVTLEPGHVLALYNSGVACVGLKMHEEAMSFYRKALEKDPAHALSLNNLGVALVDTGQPDEATGYFRRVLECSPAHPTAAVSLARAGTMLLPMSEWPACCNATLTGAATLSAESRYLILIQRAMAEWANGDTKALASTLWAAGNTRPPVANDHSKNMFIYESFLTQLLAYRNSAPAVYAGTGSPLFLVGDSHSLTYANTQVTWNSDNRKISSHLIVGAKAWHIAAEKPNKYTASLDAYISRLPAGSPLLCAFGEIDCRIDNGILPYWKKTGGALEKIVTAQVANYVTALSARAAPKSLKLTFLSIPPPHPATGDRRNVIKLFNAALEKQSRKAGQGYIDLYPPVAGKDGYAKIPFCVDDFHLKPEVLAKALV